MAANAGTEILANSVKDLTDKVMVMAQRPPQVTAAPIRDSAEQAAQKGANDMLVETCKTAISIVRDSASTTQKATDPMETVQAVVAIAKEMIPKQDGSQVAIVNQMMESNRVLTERVSAMQDRQIEDLRSEVRQSRRVDPPAPKTLVEQLKEIEDITSITNRFAGKGDDEDDPKGKRGGSSWMDLIPVAAPVILGIFQLGANMFYNAAVAKGGPGTAQPPPPVTALSPEQQAMAQQAGMIPHQQQQSQQQQENNPVFNVYARFHPMLEELRRPMLEFFNEPDSEFPGAEFAENLIRYGKGREFYEQLKSAGPDNLLGLLQSYPPIWGAMSLDIAKVQKFVTDFIQHDEILEQQQRENEQPEPEIVPRRVVKIPQA